MFVSYFIILIIVFFTAPVITFSQNKYSVKVIQPDSIQAPVISLVTVTSENKNLVIWEQTPHQNIQYFKIYRDSTFPTKGWINVGKVKYSENNSFTDNSSFPNVRSYQYIVSTIDQCGNEIFSNHPHKTLKLSVNEVNDSVYVLEWNKYEGYKIEGYKIYRGTNATNLSLIDSTTAMLTTFTENERLEKETFYQVEAIENLDTIPTGKKRGLICNKTRSNIASKKSVFNSSDTTRTPGIVIYPNPMTLNAVVVFPYDSTHKCQLSILDLSGHTVFTKPVYSGEIEIVRKNLNEGIYILQIEGKKNYRKKLIVSRNKV